MNATQIASAIAAINVLDLDSIKSKLMHAESGEGWSAVQADAVEIDYRRFLTLMKLYPNELTAPLVDVDTFWHYHILDTVKYAADCTSAFGYFLHHYPYLGMDGNEDDASREDAGARMQELVAATFGTGTQGSTLAAWCGAAVLPSTKPGLAWCGAATQASPTPSLAWCGMATSTPRQQSAAWCGASAPQAAVAWCGMAISTRLSPALAWCGAARPMQLAVSRDLTLTVTQAN